METLLSLVIGIGLSAACGFRVFVPLWVVSVAALSGHLSLAHGFEWLGTWPAFLALTTATTLEVTAYYVPWLDNFLDTLATPAAVVAGTVVSASVVTDVSPMVRWTFALVAGGGIAGTVQAVTVAARGLSSASTGGLANPLIATAEAGGATMGAITSIALPWVGVAALAVAGGAAWFWLRRPVSLPTLFADSAGPSAQRARPVDVHANAGDETRGAPTR